MLGRLGRYLGYGVGDFGLNIFWNTLSLILVFWYVEVVGLDPRAAGLVFFIGVVWDALADLWVADLAQRTRTRFGTYRPYLLVGGVVLGGSFCLLFWIPPWQGLPLVLTLTVVHILFRTAYTFVAVPYAALASRLTFDSGERTWLAGIRMGFAFAGLLWVSGFIFPLARTFGEREGMAAWAYFGAAAVGALTAFVAFVICFFGTREKAPPGHVEAPSARSGFIKLIGEWRENPALSRLLLLLFVNSVAVSSFLLPLSFYLEASSGLLAEKEVVLSAYALATVLSVPVWTVVSSVIGVRQAWLWAVGVLSSSALAFALFGPIIIGGIPIQIFGYGAGYAAFGVYIWALIPNAIEIGQWHSGKRREGAVFGASLFVQKTAGGVAGILVGLMLAMIGYDRELGMQLPETLARLSLYLYIVPPLLVVLSGVLVLRLPFTEEEHRKIVSDLDKRTR